MPEPSSSPASPEVVESQPAEIEVPVADAGTEETPEPVVAEEQLSWQASEYVHHHKGASWYMGLGGVVLALVVVAYIFKLWLSIGVFIAMGMAIAVYAHRPPRVLTYELDGSGVTIEGKHYPWSNFRSFGVMSDVEWHAIDLEPTQRLMPRLTMLFSDEDYDEIVEHLLLHLPQVDHTPDFIERLSRYLRF